MSFVRLVLVLICYFARVACFSPSQVSTQVPSFQKALLSTRTATTTDERTTIRPWVSWRVPSRDGRETSKWSSGLPSRLTSLPQRDVTKTINQALSFSREIWWAFPLILCLLPVFSLILFQRPLPTPDWWKMVSIPSICHSHGITRTAVLTGFLGSNISYAVAGGILLRNFPTTKRRSLFNKYNALGWWVLAAGLVSTVFHSFQALGNRHVAEALCYVDHGLAGSAVFYFWHVCGRPRGWVAYLCGIGLFTLAYPTQYFGMHSTWHLLSAATAVGWAQQGRLQRVQRLVSAMQEKKMR